ncbi:hypothetical protein AEGHOMDF_3554 [Methylobacterium soli]|nr:hypothetical protein AEGHOMDF_3554 [Methylobacterium soli]
MLMMLPPDWARTMRRAVACAISQRPLRLVSTTRSQASSSRSRAARVTVTPALFTRTAMGPNLPSASSSAGAMVAGAVTSSTRALALPLAASICATVSARASARRAVTETRAPASARRRAK